MDPPETRYAKSGDIRIAYQVLGRGPVDLVYGRAAVSHLELAWEEPTLAGYYRSLAGFTRLILWDKRGTGLSDRAVGLPTLEERMDDVRAVLDAVGSRRAVLFGGSESAALEILFAATYPERTLGLVLLGPVVRGLWAPDFPWARTREEHEEILRTSENDWGSEAHVRRLVAAIAPSRLHDAAFRRWSGRLLRFGSSPSADEALARMNMEIDVRAALSAVHVPTLVMLTRSDPFVRPESVEYVASQIPGARLIALPGSDYLAWANSEGRSAQLAELRRFVTDLPSAAEADRVLMTVLFADIVGSTRRASQLGDRAWTELRDRFFHRAKAEVVRFRGRQIKTTGDGLLAVFDGPTRAVRGACAMREEARAAGLEIRAGLHTGECLVADNDVHGIAVHIASRVSERAGPGEVLVSGTVRDLSVGSGVRFRDRGRYALRGVEGKWRMFSAEDGVVPPAARGGRRAAPPSPTGREGRKPQRTRRRLIASSARPAVSRPSVSG
jgi:class 3 adenylate cyclase